MVTINYFHNYNYYIALYQASLSLCLSEISGGLCRILTHKPRLTTILLVNCRRTRSVWTLCWRCGTWRSWTDKVTRLVWGSPEFTCLTKPCPPRVCASTPVSLSWPSASSMDLSLFTEVSLMTTVISESRADLGFLIRSTIDTLQGPGPHWQLRNNFTHNINAFINVIVMIGCKSTYAM